MTGDLEGETAELVPRFDLGSRTVLVTGAGRGLGQALAIAVAAAGARVVAVARSAEQLESTHAAAAATAGPDLVTLPWDLSETTRIGELLDRAEELAGPIDSVVHAAGAQHREPADQISVDDWRRVIAVNLEAPFFLSCALHRRRRRPEQAETHLWIGSLTGTVGRPNLAPYAASKGAVATLVRTLAVEWADTGARVNGLVPGYFKTQLTAGLLDDPEAAAEIRNRIPMARLGRPGDLTGAAVFLLSGAASYVTGQLVAVDGGWLAA